MSGTASGSASSTANLAIAGTLFLAGTIAGSTSHAADLEAHAYMSGTSAGAASESAALELLVELSTFTSSVSVASGDLKGAARLSAFAPCIAEGTATLRLASKIGGLSIGLATTQADLTVGEVMLSGTIAGIAASSAALTLDGVALSASVAGLCATSAALSIDAALSGTSAGATSTNANLEAYAFMSGTSAGVAASSAALSLDGVALSGTSAGLGEEQTAALRALVTLAATEPGSASSTANLTVTAGWGPEDIAWAALWDPNDAVDDGSGDASSLPNSAAGGSASADLTFASTYRPAIITVTAANNEQGLDFTGAEVGITTEDAWWEMASTSGKFLLVIVGILPSSSTSVPVVQTRGYTTLGGFTFRPRTGNNSIAIVEESGGAVAITNTATTTEAPITHSVPEIMVLEFAGNGGTARVRQVFRGLSDLGDTATLGTVEASTNRGMCLGGQASTTPDWIGDFLLGAYLKAHLSWEEDARLLLYAIERWGCADAPCIHRFAPIAHLTTHGTITSGEYQRWLGPRSNTETFDNITSTYRPAVGTLVGRSAPYFRGNTELNYLDDSYWSSSDLFNAAEWHVFVVFDSAGQDATYSGTAYYDLPAFLCSTDGKAALGLASDGEIRGGVLGEFWTDFECVSPANGYDDGNPHVIHFWFDGTDLNLRVDDGTLDSVTVTEAFWDMSAAGLRVGADWNPDAELEATMHLWAHGAMTTDEVADFYAALAATYGVTTP